MSDIVDQKIFDGAVADDVALEQLGYQQGMCEWNIAMLPQLLTSL